MTESSTAVTVQLPALTSEEDTFCLGIIEYGGNLAAAYHAAFGNDQTNPGAKGRLMLSRPEIAKRVAELTAVVQEHALISLGSHLNTLAGIRDLSIARGEMKVALAAEVKRGEAAGYYKQKIEHTGETTSRVVIEMSQSTPTDPKTWSEKFGTGQVVDAVVKELGA